MVIHMLGLKQLHHSFLYGVGTFHSSKMNGLVCKHIEHNTTLCIELEGVCFQFMNINIMYMAHTRIVLHFGIYQVLVYLFDVIDNQHRRILNHQIE